jgi:hypothetical protein
LFNIFPNPVHDNFIVSGMTGVTRVKLVNAIGEEVLNFNATQFEQEIDVSHLPGGFYFIKAENRKGRGVFKLLKE